MVRAESTRHRRLRLSPSKVFKASYSLGQSDNLVLKLSETLLICKTIYSTEDTEAKTERTISSGGCGDLRQDFVEKYCHRDLPP